MFKLLFISLASFPVLCSSMNMYEKCYIEVFNDEVSAMCHTLIQFK